MASVTFHRVVLAIRATAQHPLPDQIEPEHSLIYDLGFDSMAVAMLSIALEDQFSFPVMLDTWIAIQDGPSGLTVGSLESYMGSLQYESAASV